MDSGNSGSIQSSSGGDDEYESRAGDSSFSNPSSTTTTTTTTNNNPLLFSQSSTMFDPLSNYFDPPIPTPTPTRPQTQHSSLLNLDMPSWSKSQTNPFFTSQTPMSFPQISEPIATTVTPGNINNNNNQVMQQQQQQDQTSQSQVGARNPKKRSRASRRAPTTVLTTDTSNFRAMVQEFTGIPAPPFTSTSFPRTRLDLFTSPTPSSFRSQPSSFNQNHHHLLRPFPQKFQPQVSPFSTTNNNNINSVITTTTPPSDQLGLLKPPQSSSSNNYLLNNMQMQNLTFQSFLQPSSSNDQFGLSSHHTQLNANNPSPHLPNVVLSPRNHEEDGNGYNFSGSASSNLNFSGGKAVADNVSASGSTTRENYNNNEGNS